MGESDVLQVIPTEKLEEVRDLFKTNWPDHVHIYNFIDTCMRWKRNKKYKDCITVYSPDGDWSDGSIIGIIEIFCYDVLVYSMDKSLGRLKKALLETKVIKWKNSLIFPSTRIEFKDPLAAVKKQRTEPFNCHVPSYIWWLPKEKALQYEWSIPPDYYLADLEPTHAVTLNEVWPHRHPGSENYISALLDANGGVGLFSKQTGEICAWVMKSYFGGLGLLQTAEKYKRKGLGSLIAKIYSKKLAEDDLDVIGCIVHGNAVSQKLFTRLGFEKIIEVTWLLDVKDSHGNEI